MNNNLTADLDAVLGQTEAVWPALRNTHLLITGGTGFIGKWLLEALRHANRELGTGISAVILTRDPERFKQSHPHLGNDSAFEFVAGDTTNLPVELKGSYHMAIHAATDASAHLNATNPLLMFDTIVTGTRAMLEWAVANDITRLLFISSGAVYGRQPPTLDCTPESFRGGPDCTDAYTAYGQGKRAAEALCGIFARQHGIEIPIARCFGFLGPYQPLDIHFAVGNFIQDAMRGGPITVKADGTPFRSYLYASDMTAWLLHLLVRGESIAPVNVGSDEPISIRDLAAIVSETLGPCSYSILGTPVPGVPAERYVCSNALARDKYNLRQTVALKDAILKTAAWHGWNQGVS